jgi:hypothetical protein
MRELIEHAVEGSIHRPIPLMQPGITQNDAVTEDHGGERRTQQPAVVELQLTNSIL